MPKTVPQERLAILTVGTPSVAAPAWTAMFGWPIEGHYSVPIEGASAIARKRWAARLDAAVMDSAHDVLIVADGLGCLATSWWARLSPVDYVRRVAGAVFVSPHDAPAERAQFAAPSIALPFPSLVLRPGDAAPPLDDAALASWGSRVIAGRRLRDHQAANRAWRHAHALFLRLSRRVVDHKAERAAALLTIASSRP